PRGRPGRTAGADARQDRMTGGWLADMAAPMNLPHDRFRNSGRMSRRHGRSRSARPGARRRYAQVRTMSSEQQREALVRDAYSAAARDPGGEHPFAVGRELALGVGYPAELLDRLPASAVAAFAGVAAVSVNAALEPGQRVLDLGCGAGLDSLVAAERVG